MRVSDIERREVEEGIEWSAVVSVADERHTLRFGGPAELVSDADASMFLAATVIAAMAWQQDLHVEGSVSSLLLGRVDRLTRSYHAFDPTLRVPTVTTDESAPRMQTGARVGSFFSRGVDSTFTASVDRTDPAPIEALLYCRTLEPHHSDEVRSQELAHIRTVADRVGLPLHVIWTNMREFTDPIAGWSAVHGSGLGAMAQLVGQGFAHLVVPTAYDLNGMSPCGSHPAVDPLFSSEAVTVHHDHVDRSRQDKVDWLATHRPDLLELIKVCYSEDRVDNCGRCHKCLLTLSSLRAAGGLEHTRLFPTGLDLDLVRAQRLVGVGTRQLWLPVARRAHERADTELSDAIEEMLRLTATPPLRELLAARWPRLSRVLGGRARVLGGRTDVTAYDPDRATTFERFDRAYTDSMLSLLRHGEVLHTGEEPPAHRLRASSVAGSIAASIRHRLRH